MVELVLWFVARFKILRSVSFFYDFERPLMLTMAAFIRLKYSKNIVKY